VGTQNDPLKWTDAYVMNHRVAPPGTAKGRWAWLFLSILLPALANRVSTQATSSPNALGEASYPLMPQRGPRPYLSVIGPPPLRFEDIFPPPDVSANPPAGAPPKLPEKAKAADTDVVLPKPAPPPVVVAAPKPTETHAAPPAAPAAPRILPDDVPAQVHPEDFLPYFQYPGAGPKGRSAEAHPAPPLPVSTATYTQGP